MLRRDGKVREIWGRQFRIVKDGLDEAEVFAFIGRLIEQNSELSKKLEHIDSLKRLAESAIIEATKQANRIKIETKEEANQKAKEIITQAKEETKADANRITAEAEQRAQDMIKAAEEKARAQAEKLVTEAEQKAKAQAEKIIAEAERKAGVQAVERTKAEAGRIIAEAEQRAQDMIKAADEKARAQEEKIVTEALQKARAEAERILAEAQPRAEKLAQEKLSAAEQKAKEMIRAAEEKAEEIERLGKEQASRTVFEAKERAEQEAELVRREAEQLLPTSKRIAETEIREIARRVLGEFVSSSTDIETTATRSRERASRTRQPSRIETTVRGPAHTIDGEPQRHTPLSQEEVEEKEGPALYRGAVEVALPPPVAMSNMLKLHRWMAGTQGVNVLDVTGSAGRGVIIKLFLRNPTPLIDMLEKLPEVDEVTVLQKQANKTHPPQTRPGEPAVERIVVTLKR